MTKDQSGTYQCTHNGSPVIDYLVVVDDSKFFLGKLVDLYYTVFLAWIYQPSQNYVKFPGRKTLPSNSHFRLVVVWQFFRTFLIATGAKSATRNARERLQQKNPNIFQIKNVV